MALIAGYLARNGKASRAEIESIVQCFRILPEDDLNDYQNLIVETRFGYVMRKFKKKYPVQLEPYNDVSGHAVLILGFLSSTEGGLLSDKQLEQCAGEFVAVCAEASGKVHVVNDRFGSRPFYLLRNQGGTYFS